MRQTRLVSLLLPLLLALFQLASSAEVYITDADLIDDYDDDDFYGGTNLASDSVFRDGLEYLINNNGGVMYINTTEDINLHAGYIPLYSSSKINITIRGISEPDRPPPLINLRDYYIYVFGNIDLSLENLHIKGGYVLNRHE